MQTHDGKALCFVFITATALIWGDVTGKVNLFVLCGSVYRSLGRVKINMI